MATGKKKTSNKKSDRMPGFFESGPVNLGPRPKGYSEVLKDVTKGKKKK